MSSEDLARSPAAFSWLTVACADAEPIRCLALPPGEFRMGDAEEARRVTLSRPAALASTPVTVAQFAAFVAATGHVTTAERRGTATVMRGGAWVEVPGPTWRDPGFPGGTRHPVTVVSWFDAAAFCAWLSHATGLAVRLPTEAEREYATRAGTTTAWSFGDDAAEADAHAWHRGNTGAGTPAGGPRPVGSLRPNPWGLFDMHGNVIEWCQDWHEPEAARLATCDPHGPASGTQRVLRGGCWDFPIEHGRSANRGFLPPDYRFGFFGFRVAIDMFR
jgi:sulfatase modifying factor 1